MKDFFKNAAKDETQFTSIMFYH